MGKLADDFAYVALVRCKLGDALVLIARDPADAKAVQAALDDQRRTSTGIADTLANNGYNVSADVIGRHRRKACACVRAS